MLEKRPDRKTELYFRGIESTWTPIKLVTTQFAVGLTIEGLHITDLCEDKISIDQRVVKEMKMLRTERSLKLCFTPLYICWIILI
jgi:hypothetical protein